ncbi:MAG TPA: hypothetical protein PLB53_07525, partial [Candidatus Atribacteria bacterium]|nr:hypothetical protein [Candidatus Atribacteria bacterium]
MRFLKLVLILSLCLVLLTTLAGCSPAGADLEGTSQEDSTTPSTQTTTPSTQTTTPSTTSIDTTACLKECLDFCAEWCQSCTVCNCEEGAVTLSGGETCLGQCFDLCEEWYNVCQECEEEETCQPCQPQEEP